MRAWSGAQVFLLTLTTSLLFLPALRVFFSSVYFQNLVSLSLNASLLFLFVLFAPVIYLITPRHVWTRTALRVLVVILIGARLGMFATGESTFLLPLSALGVAAFLILLPLLLAAPSSPVQERWAPVALGFVVAFAMDASLALLGTSRDPGSGFSGLSYTLVWGAVSVYLIAVLAPPTPEGGPGPASSQARRLLVGSALGAWLFLEYGVLGSPFAVTRWNALPLAPVALGTIVGLLAMVASTIPPLHPVRHRGALLALHVLALLALIDHVFVHSPILPGLLVILQAVLVLDLFLLLSVLAPWGVRATAGALLYTGLVLVLLSLVFAFTLVYAFVPLSFLWQGAEVVLLPAALLWLLLAAALLSRGFRQPLRVPPLPRGALSLFLILILATSVVPLAFPARAPGTPVIPAPFAVLTYNVHQGFSNDGGIDPDLYVEVIRDSLADVIALQESDTARFTSGHLDLVGYLGAVLGYHTAYGPPTREQSFGVALLSRYPILIADSVFLTSSEAKRPLLVAQIDVVGVPIWILVLHMGLEAADRDIQVAEVLARAAALPGPVVVAGDFNACPSGMCPMQEVGDGVYASMTGAYRDVWTEAGFARDDPLGFTFAARDPRQRIDYVFVSSDLTVLGAVRPRTPTEILASDHLPVLAVLAPGP
ncbi:MAG: endonuclease/exonuclease/phosphatase family protein [Thermoplasmata archaeon]